MSEHLSPPRSLSSLLNAFLDLTTVFLPLLAIAAFIFLVILQWPYTMDDAYITFRYSANLAAGWGLSFNQSPPWVEGYTSILWALIMALPHALGQSAVLVSKVLGVTLTLAALGISSAAAFAAEANLPLRLRLVGAAAAAVIFLSFPFFAEHAVSGMETALATFFYAALVALSLLLCRLRSSRWLLPLACLLLGLTRPEANLFCLVLLALSLLSLPSPSRRAFFLTCLAFYLLPGLLYFLWRYFYYGMLFPLPFYIKSAGFQLSGIAPTFSFLNNMGLALIFPVLFCLIFRPAKALPLVVPALALAAYLLTVDHIMGYGDRYFYPFVPVFAVLGGIGLMNLLAALPSALHLRVKAALLSFLLLALMLGFLKGRQEANFSLAYAGNLNRAHVLLGQALASLPWRDPHPLLVIGDAGAVPYFSGLPTIDSFGLNDPYIATHFSADRSTYILSKIPTVIVVVSKSPDHFDPEFPHDLPIYNASVASGYTQKAIFPFDAGYYLWALWNPTSPDAPILQSVLGAASQKSHILFAETGSW